MATVPTIPDALYIGATAVRRVYQGPEQVWPAALVPFTFNGQHLTLDVSTWDSFATDVTFEIDIENMSSPNSFGRFFSARTGDNTTAWIDAFHDNSSLERAYVRAGDSTGSQSDDNSLLDTATRRVVGFVLDGNDYYVTINGVQNGTTRTRTFNASYGPSNRSPLRVGNWDTYASSNRVLHGDVYRITVKRTSTGAVIAEVLSSDYAAPSFTDAQGNTWNVVQ